MSGYVRIMGQCAINGTVMSCQVFCVTVVLQNIALVLDHIAGVIM